MTILEVTSASSSLLDKVASSGPLVAFQLIIIAAMYKYFQKELDKKDAIISKQSEENKLLNQKMLEIAMKNNEIIQGLKDWLKETLNK